MSNVKRITPSSFNNEVLQAAMPVIVVFVAKGDGRNNRAVITAIRLGKMSDGEVTVGYIEGSLEDKIFKKYRIPSIPTTVVFKGGSAIAHHYGEASVEKLKRMLGTAGLDVEEDEEDEEEEEGEARRA